MTNESSEPPVQLPPCPDGFVCQSAWSDTLRRIPPTAKYIGTVDFNSFNESYRLHHNRGSRAWRLIASSYNEEEGKRYRAVLAEAPYMDIPPKVAAIYLLAAVLKATYSAEPWHIVTGAGLLTRGEIHAIFDMLFSEPTNTEPESPSAAATEELSMNQSSPLRRENG